MKCKIMTWFEFREMCRKDAQRWYNNGYTSDELTAKDILNEYPDGYFCDSTDGYHDGSSSCFTPDWVAQRTLDFLKKMEV